MLHTGILFNSRVCEMNTGAILALVIFGEEAKEFGGRPSLFRTFGYVAVV